MSWRGEVPGNAICHCGDLERCAESDLYFSGADILKLECYPSRWCHRFIRTEPPHAHTLPQALMPGRKWCSSVTTRSASLCLRVACSAAFSSDESEPSSCAWCTSLTTGLSGLNREGMREDSPLWPHAPCVPRDVLMSRVPSYHMVAFLPSLQYILTISSMVRTVLLLLECVLHPRMAYCESMQITIVGYCENADVSIAS